MGTNYYLCLKVPTKWGLLIRRWGNLGKGALNVRSLIKCRVDLFFEEDSPEYDEFNEYLEETSFKVTPELVNRLIDFFYEDTSFWIFLDEYGRERSLREFAERSIGRYSITNVSAEDSL